MNRTVPSHFASPRPMTSSGCSWIHADFADNEFCTRASPLADKYINASLSGGTFACDRPRCWCLLNDLYSLYAELMYECDASLAKRFMTIDSNSHLKLSSTANEMFCRRDWFKPKSFGREKIAIAIERLSIKWVMISWQSMLHLRWFTLRLITNIYY